MKNTQIISIILAGMIISVNVAPSSATISVSVPISYDVERTNIAGLSFDEQRVYVEIIYQLFVTANVSLSAEIDRTAMAPGEWSTLSLWTTPTSMKFELHLFVSIISQQGWIVIIDRKDVTVLYQLQVPVQYDLDYIQVAVIPFDIPTLSGELTLFSALQAQLNSRMTIETKGIQPDSLYVPFSEDSLSYDSPFQMQSEYGAKITLKAAGIQIHGNLHTKALLQLSGVPEPLEKERSTDLREFSGVVPINVELFELTTSETPTTTFMTTPSTTVTVTPATSTSVETKQEPLIVTVTQTERITETGPIPGFGLESIIALFISVLLLRWAKRRK